MEKKPISGIMFSVLIISIFASTLSPKPALSSEVHSQEKAPDFALTDIYGEIFCLYDCSAKVVLIEFFSTLCSACVKQTPALRNLYGNFSQDQLEMISISSEEETVLQNFGEEDGIEWFMARDTAAVANDYGLEYIPTIFIVDSQRYIRYRHVGLTEESTLRSEIERLSKTIYVDDDNTDGPWDGTQGHPYQNITSGIEHASDQSAIYVCSGAYNENVFINKSISLIGEDRNTTVIDGNGKGIVLYVTVDNVYVSNFTVQNGQYGIRLRHSKHSKLEENNVKGNKWFGIEIDHSGNCTLRDNNLVGNGYNLGVDGASLFDFVNDIGISNFVNGKPIYYLLNQKDFEIDSLTFQAIGYLCLVNSTNVDVRNLDLRDNVEGILFAYTSNSTIRNVNVTSNWNGIYLKSCSHISVSGNNANNNFDYGIALRSCTNCTVAGNNADNNGWAGISLATSWNCTVVRNNASNNYYCIHLVESGNNLVRGNNAYTGNYGYSIALYRSNNNNIYHNNFDNSLLYTAVKSRNVFDNGLEGNYWSSYNGTDANQDGIGDTPYVIGEDNQDNHPLMNPWYPMSLKGDVNSDGIVDIYDLIIWANTFHSKPGWPNWNPDVDLNQDEIIDIFDAVVIAVNYGKT